MSARARAAAPDPGVRVRRCPARALAAGLRAPAPARVLRAAILLAAALAAPPARGQAAAPVPPAANAREEGAAAATARVTYLAGTSAYVDAGERAGLRIGDTLRVVRDGAVVARLQVDFLSSLHASCRTLSGAARVGDRVIFVALPVPAPARADTAAIAAPVPSGRPARPRREPRVRGRIGARYLASRGRAPSEFSLSQPSFDVRLDGRNLAASTLDFVVDARGRRTYRPDTSRSDDRLRVYRLGAALHTRGGHARLTLGRQFATALSGVSLFDGAQIEADRGRFGAGAFAGTQPGVEDFGWSDAVREAGAFVRLRQAPRARLRWSLTMGGITSRERGEINRDYFVLEGAFTGARTSGLVTHEVDWNRGWRAEGQATLSLTSTYAMVRAQVRERLALDAGFDNRRSVRLYRDRVTPLTEFDDDYRQGLWAGATANLPRQVRLRADTRTRGGGAAGRATAHSLSAEAPVPWRVGLTLRARTTRYAQPQTSGWLHAAGLDARLGASAGVELSGGVRTERDALDPALDSRSSWCGVDVDLHMARRLYLLLSAESEFGRSTGFDQQYLSLSYRF